MKPIKISFNHWIPKILKVNGIVLYPFILFSCPPDRLSSQILQHEMIHIRQIRKKGFCFFYALYLYEYFINLCRYRNHDSAYRHISYEEEAYALQNKISLTDSEKQEVDRYFKAQVQV